MAYTILQQPTTPNVTNTNLVYTVSSSNSLLPQFNFTSNLYYSGSSTKLTGFTFSSNKLKTGTIDLARPLGDYLSFDYNWKINNSSSLDNSVKQFDVKFGEAYGTSADSVVTSFPNLVSQSIELFKGAVYPSEYTNGFNWTSQPLLTNSPATQSFSSTDYLTATVYDTNVTVKYYQTGSLTATKNYVPTSNFSAIPISPLNIGLYTESDAITLDVTGSSIRYEKENDCRIEKQRFAFTNKFGFWDYYTNHTALRKRTNIDRNTYSRDFIDYTQRVPSYNISNRGDVQYYTEYTDEFEFTTDQVTAETSQWLREMFESNEVYLQSGSDFIPINILNSNETIVNNTARYKNYQYTVNYRFANNREPR
jgi:hypothetical protein